MGEVSTGDAVLDEIVRRIVEVADPDRIILFGSRARGDAREDSDYDVLVVADCDLPQYARTVPIYRATSRITEPVDIVWWTPEEIDEWRNVHSFFVTRAVREGQVLYERAA
ncbi:MAG: nucleotidyltransferase domain-containing protein [Acidobacteriota bacterium]|nr:nucleotidyltransferase domain-containing protein [Acidobacteriota bacterium]